MLVTSTNQLTPPKGKPRNHVEQEQQQEHAGDSHGAPAHPFFHEQPFQRQHKPPTRFPQVNSRRPRLGVDGTAAPIINCTILGLRPQAASVQPRGKSVRRRRHDPARSAQAGQTPPAGRNRAASRRRADGPSTSPGSVETIAALRNVYAAQADSAASTRPCWRGVSGRRVSSGSLWKRQKRNICGSKRSKTYQASCSSWTKGTRAWP